jgi:peptide-methionine (S)-S-oxide reductase
MTMSIQRMTTLALGALAVWAAVGPVAVAKAPAAATATFAGGCFWSMEAAFEQLKGVRAVESGYEGGHVPNPSYEAVCTGTTGHAETIRVTYDPAVVTYGELLAAYFAVVDPTTLNRQGADEGSQYRSVIFAMNASQLADARKAIANLTAAHTFGAPIVTTVEAAKAFYPAEAYHQDYYTHHKFVPYSLAVIAPKVAKLRHAMPNDVK